MGEEQSIFAKMKSAFLNKTRVFVAFLFLVFTMGMLFAMFLGTVSLWLLLIPPLFGLLAYYNEKFSLFLFVIFLFFMFV